MPDSPPVPDSTLTHALRAAALALAESLPDKVDAAPLNQAAAALKTTVELIKLLESADDATEREQTVRWEFHYHGQVQDAPPWANGDSGAPGPVPGGGVWAAVGQDRAGHDRAGG